MGPFPAPTSQAIVAVLRALVTRLPIVVVAGVVYGSVAKGSHGPASDVDALLITDGPVSAPDRATVIERYTSFQADLGLRPDTTYPVELFTVDECRSILGLSTSQMHPEALPPRTSADAWEVLYALATPHLVVVGEDIVAALRTAALRRLVLLRAFNATGRATESAR